MELLQPAILLQLVVGGLLTGALYALLACGLNLVFGVMGVINLAHAEVMLIGSFAAYLLFSRWNINPLLALPLVMGGLFLLGALLQRLLLESVVGKEELSSLLVTYGLSILLINLGLLFFTSEFKAIPFQQGALLLGDLVISKPRGLAGIVAILITAAVFLFLKKARLGKAIRAVAAHPDVAIICGIDVQRIRALTFGLASAMAGAAGVMWASIQSFAPTTGSTLILRCFAIIILGGMGNLAGALYGALLLGVAEALVAGFMTSQWAEGVAYLLLVLVLLFRPTGLKGAAHGR